jgi:predicted DNA-binding transcriptional regulator AlpA
MLRTKDSVRQPRPAASWRSTHQSHVSVNQRLLREREVAPIVGSSVGSLRRWRRLGKGPPFKKLGTDLGSPVRYDADELSEWIASRPTGGEVPKRRANR